MSSAGQVGAIRGSRESGDGSGTGSGSGGGGSGSRSGTGKHSKRSRTGCLTCRRRHYKCDETYPRCERCLRAGVECRWSTQSGPGTAKKATIESDSYGNEIIVEENDDTQMVSVILSTEQTDALSYYLESFHHYSYQICAWTNLLPLPRRSHIPSILQFQRRSTRKLTNWANFFLPHLATATPNDPLSLAIAAFTAYRMKDTVQAVQLYAKVLGLLRAILRRRDAASMNNQEFLRIWATTLLLAEYEAQLGNQQFQSQHVDGATTLSFIAATRFQIGAHAHNPDDVNIGIEEVKLPVNSRRNSISGHSEASTSTSNSIPETDPVDEVRTETKTPAQSSLPRSERELPAYLMQLTQRLRHSSAICQSLDTEWPTFEQPPIERQNLGGLLEKSAECYAHVMPLVEEFYTRMAIAPPTSQAESVAMMTAFSPRVFAAKASIQEYRAMLARVGGSESAVFSSCAEPGFPFSPVIKFVNPLMAQPTVISHVFVLFLAPFITPEEHYESLRYISGVFAGFEDVEGLKMDAAFPDVYVAAFWKKGFERTYFHREVYRRRGDFMYVINRIWDTVDMLSEARGGQLLSTTEILGISLKEYRDAQARGLRLQHTRH